MFLVLSRRGEPLKISVEGFNDVMGPDMGFMLQLVERSGP